MAISTLSVMCWENDTLLSAACWQNDTLSALWEYRALSRRRKQQSTKSYSGNAVTILAAEATVVVTIELTSVEVKMTAVRTGAESNIHSVNAESIIHSTLPAESMILSVPPTDATRKHTGTAHQQCIPLSLGTLIVWHPWRILQRKNISY